DAIEIAMIPPDGLAKVKEQSTARIFEQDLVPPNFGDAAVAGENCFHELYEWTRTEIKNYNNVITRTRHKSAPQFLFALNICHLSFVICHCSFVIAHLSLLICHCSFAIVTPFSSSLSARAPYLQFHSPTRPPVCAARRRRPSVWQR